MALTLLQPFNLDNTGSYTFSQVTVSGNISAGNISATGIAGTLSATGNVIGGNLKTGNITVGTDTIRSANSTLTLDPAADGVSGLVVIAGNLQVTGTTTTVDSTVVTIDDLMINVANNAANTTQANGGGLGVGPVGAEYVKLYWDSAGNTWDSTHGISAAGTVTATQFTGSGDGLTSIAGANVTGTVANATYAVSAGIATSATTSGTVTTAAQPNITSVGTLTSLAVTGNISGGNVNSTFFGSGAGLSSITGANVTGTVANATSAATATTAGTVTANAQPNITSVGTLTSLSTSGAVVTSAATGVVQLGVDAGGSISLGLVSGASSTPFIDFNTSAVATDFNVRIQATGNTGTSGTGTLNIQAAQVTTTGAISATGNITGSYFIGNGSQLTGIAAGGIKWTTAANTTPSSPSPGDFWYDSYTDIKYQYINDGTSNVWVDQGFPTSFSSLAVTGNILAGNVSVGTGRISVGNIVNTNGNGVGNIGSSSLYFDTVHAKATSAQYADLAEMYVADANYAPGTLVDFGGDYEISQTTQSHSTRVAGVISTDPSYIMNAGQTGDFVLPVALTGKVPCWVTGKIRKGDRLVASHIPGVAAALNLEQYAPGCIIGKSLQDHDSDSVTQIQIAVGRY